MSQPERVPVAPGLGWCAWRMKGGCIGAATLNMFQNLRDHDRIFNAGDDLYGTTAELTSLDINLEDPSEALCPRQGDVLFGLGFGFVFFSNALPASSGRGDLRPSGDNMEGQHGHPQ